MYSHVTPIISVNLGFKRKFKMIFFAVIDLLLFRVILHTKRCQKMEIIIATLLELLKEAEMNILFELIIELAEFCIDWVISAFK